MVVVKIELWPDGVEADAMSIGQLEIVNDGTGDQDHGNYQVVARHAGVYYGRPGSYRTGQVAGFRRRLSPYHLLARALSACGIR